MMISALLIGFGYRGADGLPGTRIDLYQAWKYCHRIGVKRIFVVTDLDSDLPATGLLKMVIDDVVDANITTFISETKANQEYRRFKPLEFRQQLRHLAHKLDGSDRLIIYYTGHGIPGYLKLPDTTTLPISEFRDILLGSCSASSQVLWIMDCCHASGMELPYQLDQHKYHLVNPDYSILPELICVIASTRSQLATSTNKGSIFTRSLFKKLQDGVRSVYRLKSEIDRHVITSSAAGRNNVTSSSSSKSNEVQVQEKSFPNFLSFSNPVSKSETVLDPSDQTMLIYSSYPHLRYFWSWVYGSTVQVELDWSDSTIRIQRDPPVIPQPSLQPLQPLQSPLQSPLQPPLQSPLQQTLQPKPPSKPPSKQTLKPKPASESIRRPEDYVCFAPTVTTVTI
jgi:hypothetical protein